MRTTRCGRSVLAAATLQWRSLLLLLLALLQLNLLQQLQLVEGAAGSSLLLLSESFGTSESLLSPSGIFRFGFYPASAEAAGGFSDHRFGLAIWYAQLPSSVRTVVWMAARNHPPVSAEAYVKLSVPDGVLQLMDPEVSTEQPVWQSGNSKPATTLELRDTGNLLLLDNATATDTPAWQTFDTPTDTLLPGQKFAAGPSLISWQHTSNWSEGFYRAGWLPFNRTAQLTFTLSWTGDSIPNWNRSSWSTSTVTLPDDNATLVYPYQHSTLTNSTNATYAHLDAATGNFYIGDAPVITNTSAAKLQRVTLDEDGGLRLYSWGGGSASASAAWTEVGNWMNDSCRILAECGPFGVCSSNPFAPATRASCVCPEGFHPIDENNLLKGCEPVLAVPGDGGICGYNGSLFEIVNVGQFDYPYADRVYPGVQVDEAACVRRCSEDCRCAGAIYWTRGGTCFIKSSPLFNGGYPQEVGNRTAYLKVLKSSLFPRKKPRVGIIAGVASASVFFLLGSIAVGVVYTRRRRKTRRWQGRSFLFHNTLSLGPRKFTFRELSAATKHFADSERVGTGGMGSVYKGTLRSTGTLIAVKRIRHESTSDGEEGFLAEASSLSQIRHRNLMQLQGWCHEDGKLLLVYDFMPNGSLDQWLHGKYTKPNKPNCSNKPYKSANVISLSWDLRYSIVKGVAAALAYLHDEWQQCVLHRDIKSSNVMLDAEFNAHLGDFGLARLIDHQKVEKTTLMAGTLGYMAPEMPYTGKATKESDVYSFGVLLLEVVSGRQPVQSTGDVEPEDVVLLNRVWRAHESGDLLSVVDPKLQITTGHEEERLSMIRRVRAPSVSVVVESGHREADGDDYALALSRRVEQEILTENEQKVMVLKLGLLCCLPKPLSRPTMRVVNQVFISGEMATLPEVPATAYFGSEDVLEAVRAGFHPQPLVSEELVSPLESTTQSGSSAS